MSDAWFTFFIYLFHLVKPSTPMLELSTKIMSGVTEGHI